MTNVVNEVFGSTNNNSNLASLINKQTNQIISQDSQIMAEVKEIMNNTLSFENQTNEIVGNTNTIISQTNDIIGQTSGISSQVSGVSSQADAILNLLNNMNATLIDLSNNSIGTSAFDGIDLSESFTTMGSFYLANSREGFAPASAPSSTPSASTPSVSAPSASTPSSTPVSSPVSTTLSGYDTNFINYASLYYTPQQLSTTPPSTLIQYYSDALISGNSPAYINSPITPGNRYFLNTDAKCIDACNNLQNRSVLIDNVLQSNVNKSNTQGYNGLLYSLFSSIENIASSSVQDVCGTYLAPIQTPATATASANAASYATESSTTLNLPTCAPVTVYIDGTQTGTTTAYLTQSDIQEVDPFAIQSEGFTSTINVQQFKTRSPESNSNDVITLFYIISLMTIACVILYSLYRKITK